MEAKFRIKRITLKLAGGLILLNRSQAGCPKEDDSTSSGDLQIVQRESASKGSYPLVGTSQTGFWDGTGNKITAPALGAAFYDQDAWHVVFGRAEDGTGEDLHDAGAVRFDRKTAGTGQGVEMILN